ncbi:hypothetical protein [Paraburkholderia megapolitana]|uniref:hypothetical protein n=1 Tax=Paraburkholderia megapolitana TaxID=420953 RepID=UPI000B89FC24|nr:hypothetical protein [Paraburkholderia megapolitana]QDQ79853.1 hypothetical protein FNZ07_00955 [Paraburkholderia megapolitana]
MLLRRDLVVWRAACARNSNCKFIDGANPIVEYGTSERGDCRQRQDPVVILVRWLRETTGSSKFALVSSTHTAGAADCGPYTTGMTEI